MRDLVGFLRGRGFDGDPGLGPAALDALERALGVPLPEPVRELYRRCGGMDAAALAHLPMRLMSPDEVVDAAANLRETVLPGPEARYLFTDDRSNWAGVFVAGPLLGRMTILDHDETSEAPRFRDLASFAAKMIEAGPVEWADLRTDYPLTAAATADLVDDALPLAHHYLDRYRAAVAADDLDSALAAAETGLYLLPATEWPVLRDLLRSPYQFVRWTALRVAAVHRPRALVPDLVGYARTARADGNYTHWVTTVEALTAAGAEAETAALRRDAPQDWAVPG